MGKPLRLGMGGRWGRGLARETDGSGMEFRSSGGPSPMPVKESANADAILGERGRRPRHTEDSA